MMNNLATAYQLSGETTKAIDLLEKVIAMRTVSLGPGHIDTLASRHNLATVQSEAGRLDIAIPIFHEVLNLRREKLAPDHRDTLNSMNSLATCYLDTKRWSEAESLLRECLELRKKSQPEDWRLYHTMSQFGAALAAQAKPGDAERLLIDGYAGLAQRRRKIPHHRKKEVQTAAARVVQLYESTGQSNKAAEWRTKIVQRGKPSG